MVMQDVTELSDDNGPITPEPKAKGSPSPKPKAQAAPPPKASAEAEAAKGSAENPEPKKKPKTPKKPTETKKKNEPVKKEKKEPKSKASMKRPAASTSGDGVAKIAANESGPPFKKPAAKQALTLVKAYKCFYKRDSTWGISLKYSDGSKTQVMVVGGLKTCAL